MHLKTGQRAVRPLAFCKTSPLSAVASCNCGSVTGLAAVLPNSIFYRWLRYRPWLGLRLVCGLPEGVWWKPKSQRGAVGFSPRSRLPDARYSWMPSKARR